MHGVTLTQRVPSAQRVPGAGPPWHGGSPVHGVRGSLVHRGSPVTEGPWCRMSLAWRVPGARSVPGTEGPQRGTCLAWAVPRAGGARGVGCPRHRAHWHRTPRGRGGQGVPGLTQDVDVAPGDAVEAGTDGALVADVQLLDLQRPAQRRSRRRRQRPAPAHVPHGSDDWGQRRLSSPAGFPPPGIGDPHPAHLGSGAACPAPAGRPAPARCRRSSR